MRTITHLTLFVRAFCHTRVKNLLEGPDDAAQYRIITIRLFFITREVVAKTQGVIRYFLISKKMLTTDLGN